MTQQTDDSRFKIVFDALDDAMADSASESPEPDVTAVRLLASELDEIARLREIVLEVTEPELRFFSST